MGDISVIEILIKYYFEFIQPNKAHKNPQNCNYMMFWNVFITFFHSDSFLRSRLFKSKDSKLAHLVEAPLLDLL